MSDDVGLIGIGLLGSAIADRLTESGLAVIGYDSVKPQSDHVRLRPSARDVCRQCQIIIFSLPNSAIVDAVLAEVGPMLTPEHLIIDTTTGDPEDALKHRAFLAQSQTAFIEATIAGSSDLLRQGKAGIFLGGDSASLARAQPVFDILTKQCFHLGGIGAASRFKLVFNLALGLHRAVLAEALHFGQALGFDPSMTLEVLKQSPAASSVMTTKGRKMVEADYDPPQARLSQHLKDVRLMLAQAERSGIRLPLCQVHQQLLETAESLGLGASDNAAVMEAYKQAGSGSVRERE